MSRKTTGCWNQGNKTGTFGFWFQPILIQDPNSCWFSGCI